MERVNLLPPAAGSVKRNKHSFKAQRLAYFLFFLAGAFFLVSLYLRLESFIRQKGFFRLSSEYKKTETISKKIAALKKEEEQINAEIERIKKRLERRIIWSEKLNSLGSSIPEEIWLTQFSFEKKRGKDDQSSASLYLKGRLAPQGQMSPIATLSKLVNSLKENKDFFADFENIILSDLRAETEKSTETMAFSIEMPFKKERIN